MVGMDMRLSTLTTDIDVRQKATAAVGWALSNDSYVHAAALEARSRRCAWSTRCAVTGARARSAARTSGVPTPDASGGIIAVDGAGLLLDGARIEIATARHANLTLTDGAGGSPAGQVVNLGCAI